MNIFERIFSVRNDIDGAHKNITILGLKIKFSGKSSKIGV